MMLRRAFPPTPNKGWLGHSSRILRRCASGFYEGLPVVDISPLRSPNCTPEEEQLVGKSIEYACTRFGFFYVVGTGFSLKEREEIFKSGRELFDLESHHKSKIPTISGGFTRGYIPIGGESGSERFEVKEGFSYGYKWDPSIPPQNNLQGPNEWPDDSLMSSGWRDSMEDYYTKVCDTSELVVQGLSLGLGLERNTLMEHCREGRSISLLRLFHYFPYNHVVTDDGVECIGSSPHTDWGFLTLILQDSVGGLELFDQQEQVWRSVPPLPVGPGTSPSASAAAAAAASDGGAGGGGGGGRRGGGGGGEGSSVDWEQGGGGVPDGLLVNCGDYLSHLTGGRFVSPIHRVVGPPPGTDRLSFVFFYYPDYDARIQDSIPPPALSSASPAAAAAAAGEGGEEEDTSATAAAGSATAGFKYNTLFDGGVVPPPQTQQQQQQQQQEPPLPFGDYITRKWESVQRDGGYTP